MNIVYRKITLGERMEPGDVWSSSDLENMELQYGNWHGQPPPEINFIRPHEIARRASQSNLGPIYCVYRPTLLAVSGITMKVNTIVRKK